MRASQTMEEQIAAVLVASMSADASTRSTAEQQLTQGGTQPGFGLSLARVALNQALPFGTRQLAAVVLKKYVKEHWQEGEGRFIPPQTSDEEKHAIRELLPIGLADPVAKIRTATGMAIASICAWDWPHAWPSLTGILLTTLRERRSHDAVVGTLRCLSMICVDLEESQVPDVVPVLFPELLSIVAAPVDAYGLSVKRRALAVFHSCVMTLGMMSFARQRAVRDLMSPLLPGWLEAFAASLATSPNPADADQCGYVLETLKCLSQVAQFFAKTAGDALMPALGRAASLFHAIAPAYRARFVVGEGDDDDAVDSDGDEISLDAVVGQLLELIMTLTEHPRLCTVLEPALGEIVYQAIGYMCMTRAQEDSWGDDPDQYVADEDEDASSTRAMCGLLLDELADRFELAALKALAEATARRLGESEASRAAGDPAWWKPREATMLAVGTLNDALIETEADAKSANVPAPFSAQHFLRTVMDVDLAPGAEATVPSFLRGRALWVAARLAPGAPPDAAGAALRAALGALAPDASAPLRVGACRALAQYVPLAPRDVLLPLLGPAYQGLGTLLETAAPADAEGDAPEETLHLVLEAMLVVVKADADAAAAWSGALAPATLRVWAEKVADPLLAADARDVLEALAATPACLPSLHALATPTLAGVLASPEGQPPMLVESSLDMLCVLLRPAAEAEARACHAACFASVVALASRSDDVGTLQSAAECLRAFLRAGGEPSLVWGADGNGGGGDVLRAYLDVAARLLSPEVEDGACVFAAPLLGQMLRRLPRQMSPLLPEIVAAVVARVRSAKQPNLIAALLSIFARLVHADCNALVALLAGMPAPPLPPGIEPTDADTGADGIPPPTSALELVARAWTGFQPDVQGAFDIKLTTSALALLLSSGNPAVGAVVVRGPPVVDASASGTIRTRAKARAAGPEKFQPAPLPSKILDLLADAVLEAQEAEAGGDDDNDEWEEDEDGDDEGYGGGGGGGGLGGVFGGDLLERLLAKGVDDAVEDDADEREDPISAVDVNAFIKERLGAMHAAGSLAPIAGGLSQRRQQALANLMR